MGQCKGIEQGKKQRKWRSVDVIEALQLRKSREALEQVSLHSICSCSGILSLSPSWKLLLKDFQLYQMLSSVLACLVAEKSLILISAENTVELSMTSCMIHKCNISQQVSFLQRKIYSEGLAKFTRYCSDVFPCFHFSLVHMSLI